MNGLHQRNVRVDDNNKRENPPLDALQLTIEPTEPSVSEQEPADILQTDKGYNPTEEAPTHTTQHGCMINMPL